MPSPMNRLSLALRLSSSYKPSAKPDSTTLAQFLAQSKEKYLEEIRSDKPREVPAGHGWTVSMGNEAGDLDSIASSIAFSWHYSSANKQQTVSLIQIQRADVGLREENLYALQLAGLKDPLSELLFISDLPDTKPFPCQQFALVDHNQLSDSFLSANPDAKVVVVVDHHEDEGLYKDTANPRTIAPAGSCSSHIAKLCSPDIPAELATLLLCAILIDTGGLKPGGKALDVDYEAAAFLIPLSTYAPSVPSRFLPQATDGSSPSDNKIYEAPAIKDLTSQLLTKKSDVSHLSARDLLRRDYKEYSYQLGWAPSQPTIKAGLSTVPVALKKWATKGKLLEQGDGWMKERGLTVLGVLTSFHDDKRFTKSGKGKHKREMIWLIRDAEASQSAAGETTVGDAGTSASATEGTPSAERLNVDDLTKRLWTGLEDSGELKLKKYKKFDQASKKHPLPAYMRSKAYKQGNTEANRKVTAPLLKSIIENNRPLSDSSAPAEN